MASQRTGSVMLVLLFLASCADQQRLPIQGGRGDAAESVSFAGTAFDEAIDPAACIQLQGAPCSPLDDMTLYLRLARVSFERKHYGHAIVFANEAIKRDPENKDAMSIMAVSALRVSRNALDSLRSGISPKKDKGAEAKALADLLRAALGERKLVPKAGKD
jgi:hypothetical protein